MTNPEIERLTRDNKRLRKLQDICRANLVDALARADAAERIELYWYGRHLYLEGNAKQ
jgi:hypothetical protein